MVGRGLCLLALCCWLPAQAAVELTLPAQLEVGRPVTARLAVSDGSLKGLSLQPLRDYFAIEELGEVVAGPLPHRQLRLVPLRAGDGALPAWGVAALHIDEARDSKSGGAIRLRFSPPPATPWLHQALAYELELEGPQRFVRLQAAGPDPEGWLSRLASAEAEPIAEEGGRARYRLRLRWWLFALRSGEQWLQLPPLAYSHDGVVSHRFYPPPLRLQVRPLPSYLPATTQVGAVAMSAQLDGGWMRRGESGVLRLRLEAHGVPAPLWSLPLPELQEGEGILPLPAEGAVREEVGYQGVSSYYEAALPFTALQTRWWSARPWRLEWFDPTQGLRQTREVSLWMPLVVSRPVLWLLAGLGGGLLWWWLRLLWRWGRRQRQRARHYVRALGLLAQGGEARQLRQAQTELALAEGWPAVLELQGWSRRWQGLLPDYPLQGWQQGMQALCYQGDGQRLAALRSELQAMIRLRLGGWLHAYRLLAGLRLL